MTTPDEVSSAQRGNSIEPLLDVPDVARLLRAGVSTIRRMVTAGEIPSVRMGDRVLFRPSDLRQFIAERVSA